MSETNQVLDLNGREYKGLAEQLFEALSEYENLPSDVKLDFQDIGGVGHIGLFTAPGGKYLMKNIKGGYTGQFEFEILYRTTATGNAQHLKALNLVDGIADYLEQLTFAKIEMNSTTYRSTADEAGGIVYTRSGVLTYDKKEI